LQYVREDRGEAAMHVHEWLPAERAAVAREERPDGSESVLVSGPLLAGMPSGSEGTRRAADEAS
jgi:hypothetical protein